MNCAVAIFVKTPGHSPVKSRLWPDLGRDTAERLHLASAGAVRSVVVRASGEIDLQGYWATAEPVAEVAGHWPGLDHVGQAEGNLGLRMARVHRDLQRRHGAVILVGADAPQLESRQLVEAVRWLLAAQSRLVLGRARDGGFWLFGSNCGLPDPAWTRVDYSKPNTAEKFVMAMSGIGDWLEIDVLQDIDNAADIEPVRRQLLALPAPTAEQAELARMLGACSKPAEQCT